MKAQSLTKLTEGFLAMLRDERGASEHTLRAYRRELHDFVTYLEEQLGEAACIISGCTRKTSPGSPVISTTRTSTSSTIVAVFMKRGIRAIAGSNEHNSFIQVYRWIRALRMSADRILAAPLALASPWASRGDPATKSVAPPPGESFAKQVKSRTP